MQGIEAAGVAGTVLQTVKTIEYFYAEPVREVVTQLRLFPLAERGAQRLLRRECEVWPEPDQTRRFVDDFGNEIWEFLHETVAERLRFAIGLAAEHAGAGGAGPWGAVRLLASQGVPAAGVGAFLSRSSLVDDSDEIRHAAHNLGSASRGESEQVEAIGQWVYEVMRFEAGVTTIDTPASVVLAGKRGVCQDYAHVMLAICRASGIPARYVSGFIPGEGYMHAWVEALVREHATGAAHWEAFDPTHNRRPDGHYLTVAVGRDYADVSPVTGTFYGSAPGRLTAWSETVLCAPAP